MKSRSMLGQLQLGQQPALHSVGGFKFEIRRNAFRFAVLLAVVLPLTDLHGEDCESAPLPSLNRLSVVNGEGARVEFQGDIKNRMHTAHVWVNGEYRGEHELPVDFDSGQFQLLLRVTLQNETWMGSVRQVQKRVPYLTVCGNWRITKPAPRAAPSAPDFLLDGWMWPLDSLSVRTYDFKGFEAGGVRAVEIRGWIRIGSLGWQPQTYSGVYDIAGDKIKIRTASGYTEEWSIISRDRTKMILEGRGGRVTWYNCKAEGWPALIWQSTRSCTGR